MKVWVRNALRRLEDFILHESWDIWLQIIACILILGWWVMAGGSGETGR